jgi:hypothetical protein
MPIVNLSSEFTQVSMPKEQREVAIRAAHWVTASPHEWEWSAEEQELMARYCLWAYQRLEAIEHLSSGKAFLHPKPD